MKEKFLSLGAGWQQQPSIQRLHEMGYEVIAFDGNASNCDAPFIQEFHHVDIRDSQACLNKVKELRLNLAGVGCFVSDVGCVSAALIAQELGLPGLNLETALISQNKWKQKMACEAAKVPHANGILWSKDYNLFSLPDLPLIVKPVDSAGSRGITVIDRLDQLDEAYLKALMFSPSKTVVVEEFIKGKEISVETFWQNGQMHILAISERILTGVSANRIQTFSPSNDIYDKISHVVSAYHRQIGMTNGVTHSELMINSAGEVYFLESACREGGFWVFEKLVSGVTKTDFRQHYLDLLLDKKKILSGPFYNLQFGILQFIPSKDGIFKGVRNLESLNQFSGVEYKILAAKGTHTVADGSDSSRLGVLFVVDSSKEGAISKLDEVIKLLEVEYEND